MRPVSVIALKGVMIIMISLAEGDERHPPTIPARIELPVRLLSPEMADRVDAKCRIENGKRSPYAGQKKTSNSADPIAVNQPYKKRQGQSGEHDGNIVSVLPHHDAVLS